MKPEIYVSIDIETDGPCPGLHSLLSFGACALDSSKGIDREAVIGVYSANLETLPEARSDPGTMRWWAKHEEAYNRSREHTQRPEDVFPAFANWLEGLPGKPIFVGYPVAFDWPFIYYYLHRFAKGRNPFNRNAIDIESYVMALMGRPYMEVGKRDWPKHWFDPTLRHSHVALDDAMEQGLSFLRILNDRGSKVWGAGLNATGECPVCARSGGALVDGPHTYSGSCRRRKMA